MFSPIKGVGVVEKLCPSSGLKSLGRHTQTFQVTGFLVSGDPGVSLLRICKSGHFLSEFFPSARESGHPCAIGKLC